MSYPTNSFSFKTLLIGFVVIQLSWTFLGTALTLLIEPFGSSLIFQYFLIHLNFILLFALFLIFIKVILKTKVTTFISDAPTFRYSLFFISFFIWLGAMVGATILLSFFKGYSIVATSNYRKGFYPLLVLLVLVLTPLQAFSEELLFRITLFRMLDKRASNGIIILISSVLFGFAHLANKEVVLANSKVLVISYYLITGAMFTYLVIKTRGSEIAIAFHTANNLFIALFVTYQGSTLENFALFKLNRASIELDLILLFICSALVLRIYQSQK
jgi:membrane protease YdiL (CAAX protease family)